MAKGAEMVVVEILCTVCRRRAHFGRSTPMVLTMETPEAQAMRLECEGQRCAFEAWETETEWRKCATQ